MPFCGSFFLILVFPIFIVFYSLIMFIFKNEIHCELKKKQFTLNQYANQSIFKYFDKKKKIERPKRIHALSTLFITKKQYWKLEDVSVW